MGLGLDPVALQSLLRGVNPLTIQQGFEAQQDQELQSLAELVRQAQQGAQGAQSAYQQAAAAPPPQAQGHLDQLLGNVGSVLSGDPAHGQRAFQRTQTQQGDLMEARKNNLIALQQVYSQKADAADRLGNMEVAEKARTSHERVARQLQQMDDEAKFQRAAGEAKKDRDFKAGEGKLDRESAERIAGMRANVAGSEAKGSLTPSTIPIVAEAVLANQAKLTDFKQSERDDILKHLASRNEHILPQKARDTMNMLRGAKPVIARVARLSKLLNTAKPGVLGMERLIHGIQNKAGAVTQANKNAAIFVAARDGFLAEMARMTGERGTLTQQDVDRAKSLLPSLLDTAEVAEEKINGLNQFLAEKQADIIRTYSTVLPEQTRPASGQQAQPDAGAVDFVWNPATRQLEAP